MFLKFSPDYHYYDYEIQGLQLTLDITCEKYDILNTCVQRTGVVALTEAFAVACYRGQLDDVRRLSHVVRDDVDMLSLGLEFVLLQDEGCNKEHWDIIRWLMDNTQLRDNPLVLRRAFVEACEYKELEKVRWMLQYRQLARETDTIDTALGYARRSCHFTLVKCLVEHTDVDVNKMGRVGTLLHNVIWWSKRRSDLHDVCLRVYLLSDAADVYRLVNEFSANVNEQDNDGDTPLHLACSRGKQDIVEALMSCGADVNITNDNKQTPAQQAIYHKHEKLIRLLDRTSLMDTHVQRRQQKFTLKTFISVHLTALFVHSINRL
jgi:ankyrin repeat protein